ncbi:hypothetical protein DBR00_09360 [Pseudomonas sp. HMWF032]|uniref:DUF3703 domain-containing protein n=1 Tax=Pseudomonas sp. HMWF032 TaxID=2056866 RepID=UPI000D39D7FA|nr:DUF3703 domain-containing protein [Pseudomonas sp. HMWF032]PTS85945.1 hypothetical protein DBR00_09360 [Pseudomonas sp. HMWF032]PTT83736.1 hypothetical protein DBR41_09825 [Pseudomonas sp. HMWF010]
MHAPLQQAITEAFLHAEQARRAHNSAAAFAWLERAHILTQRRPLLHAKSHWLMLTLGWQQRDYREVAGQLPRIIAALLASRIWVPVGNTGRARVSAFRPMPVPEELHRLLHHAKHAPPRP